MNWYKVAMSVDDVADGRAFQLQNEFQRYFLGHLAPEEAGMFGALDPMSNDYFFSPAAAAIAMPVMLKYRAVQCAAPRRSEVALLVANHEARKVQFAPEG